MLSAALVGCNSKESATAISAPKAAPAKQAPSLEAAAQARGFTAGAMMAANPVYVFFDPQCPHCGHLWNASLPLQKSVKFIWIPVALINASSLAQGGALLAAVNPADAMTEHETSLLAGKGGISASSSLSPELEQAIKKNTEIMTSFGAEGVPFVVAKNLRTGQVISRDGSMSTAALADLLGVSQP
ncbi:MAG: thioredoxin fold domain-containing protein [Burkholderiaceae bacterium]|nr:thioredoxin fold domain-containing protein [Burkholderiaceae bacterium]